LLLAYRQKNFSIDRKVGARALLMRTIAANLAAAMNGAAIFWVDDAANV
jgi:hypothetical protein